MLQRIQTIYLLGTTIAGILMFVLPFGEINTPTENYIFNIFGISLVEGDTEEKLSSAIPVMILVCTLLMIAIISIFSFKKRMLQIKLGKFNMLIASGLLVAILFFDRTISTFSFDDTLISYGFGTSLPAIAIILLFLANRAIRKDEKLVRAADRLR